MSNAEVPPEHQIEPKNIRDAMRSEPADRCRFAQNVRRVQRPTKTPDQTTQLSSCQKKSESTATSRSFAIYAIGMFL